MTQRVENIAPAPEDRLEAEAARLAGDIHAWVQTPVWGNGERTMLAGQGETAAQARNISLRALAIYGLARDVVTAQPQEIDPPIGRPGTDTLFHIPLSHFKLRLRELPAYTQKLNQRQIPESVRLSMHLDPPRL